MHGLAAKLMGRREGNSGVEVDGSYANLSNVPTPNTSLADLLSPTPRQDFFKTAMGKLLRQLWINFYRPHVISKAVILGLMSAVLACYVGVFPWLFQLGNEHYMVLTHVTCGAMIAITGAAFLGHLAGEDTPRLLNVGYAIVGSILFFCVSGVCFAAYSRRQNATLSPYSMIPGYKTEWFFKPGTLLATGLLSLFTAIAYIVDIAVLYITAM